MTTRGWTFSDSSRVAAVCRPSCSRTCRTPAFFSSARPGVVVGLLVDRPAVGLGEDQVLVVPLGAGQHRSPSWRGLVLVQRARRAGAAAPGCGDCAGSSAPRRSGPPRTRWMLRRTVSVLSSRSMSFHCSASASDWRRPRARATVHRASLRVPRAASRTARGLVEVERGREVAAALRGRVDERGDVAGDVPALHRDRQGAGQDPVVAQHGGGGVAGVEQRV